MSARLFKDEPHFESPEKEIWQQKAACRIYKKPFVFFFGETAQAVKEAKRFCETKCEVREQCLDFAMRTEGSDTNRRHGVFGGVSGRERLKMYKEQKNTSQESQAL